MNGILKNRIIPSIAAAALVLGGTGAAYAQGDTLRGRAVWQDNPDLNRDPVIRKGAEGTEV